jgi:hypothetical protein
MKSFVVVVLISITSVCFSEDQFDFPQAEHSTLAGPAPENIKIIIKKYPCTKSTDPTLTQFAILNFADKTLINVDHPVQAIIGTQDGGYALAGTTAAFSGGLFRGGGDIFLVKLDRLLKPLWGRVVGAPRTGQWNRSN